MVQILKNEKPLPIPESGKVEKQKIIEVFVSIRIVWKQHFSKAAMLGLKQDHLMGILELND